MLKRFLKRLSQDHADMRADSIRTWADSVDGVVRISEAEPRTVVRVAGVVENVRVRPREGVPSFEVMLSDGSGVVSAVWLGRRTIPGISLGSRLIVEGRIGGGREHLQVVNPVFEFAPPSDGS